MKTTWNKGAPPSIGWWPASLSGDLNAIRWHDGVAWSAVAYPYYSAEKAAKCANLKFVAQKHIAWTGRWWL